MSFNKTDGTAEKKIKKLYKSDGTTQKQVRKLYKSDGTSLELVYSSTPDYLFLNGEEFTDFTGGWKKSSHIVNNAGGWDSRANGNARVENNKMIVVTGSGQYNGSGLCTQKKIDMRDINKLTFELSINWGSNPYSTFDVIFCSAINGNIIKLLRKDSADLPNTIIYDTADINEECIILVQVFTSNGYYIEKRINSIKVN